MNRPASARTIFVTGTDTGVGKTVLTACLLYHLRTNGVQALAMKPFCSGDRRDVARLAALQPDSLTLDEINPFFFSEPLAPLAAARLHGLTVARSQVLRAIRRAARGCPLLLVEGAGGLLAPLGEGFGALELIRTLGAEAIVAAANRLGVLNHARLTARVLQDAGVEKVKFALLDTVPTWHRRADASMASNGQLLQELLAPIPVVELPFLGPDPEGISALKRNAKKLEKKLAWLLG